MASRRDSPWPRRVDSTPGPVAVPPRDSEGSKASDERQGRPFVAAVVACAAFAVAAWLVWRNAWLGDDAHITLRVVHNWQAGYGPVFNVAERVQASTHPLWLMLVTAATWFSGERFFTVFALHGALTAFALIGVVVATRSWGRVIALLALAASMAFVDYSSSGLENSLTHALVVGFILAASPTRELPASPRWMALFAGLCVFNRLDVALVVTPLLGWRLMQQGWSRAWRLGLLAAAPTLVWFAFASVYYGSPLPITAEGKALGLGIPMLEVLERGWQYLVESGRRDPWTFALVAYGVLVGLATRGFRLLALGAGLYVAYVVSVGGCFMAGRFLALPALVVALALGRSAMTSKVTRTLSFVLVLGLGMPFLAHRAWYGPEVAAGGPDRHGLGDVRAGYAATLGLEGSSRSVPIADQLAMVLPRVEGQRPIWSPSEPAVLMVFAAGIPGYVGGPRLHALDPILLDPLLARLPRHDEHWVAGHVQRRVPEGYIESIATGENHIHHPGLRRYYEALRKILRAPFWSRERFGALWEHWTQAQRDGLEEFIAGDYRKPPLVHCPAVDLARRFAQGERFAFGRGPRAVYEGGLELRFASAQSAARVEIGLHPRDEYVIEFRLGDRSLGHVQIDSGGNVLAGVQVHEIEVPTGAHEGFDRVRVFAIVRGDGIAGLAHLHLSR